MSNINCSALAFNGSDHDVLITGVAMPFIVHYLKNCIAPGKRDKSVHWPHYLPQSKCHLSCCFTHLLFSLLLQQSQRPCSISSIYILIVTQSPWHFWGPIPTLFLCNMFSHLYIIMYCASIEQGYLGSRLLAHRAFVLINKGLYHMSRTGMVKKRNHAGVVIHYWRNIEPMKVVFAMPWHLAYTSISWSPTRTFNS